MGILGLWFGGVGLSSPPPLKPNSLKAFVFRVRWGAWEFTQDWNGHSPCPPKNADEPVSYQIHRYNRLMLQ